MEYWDLYTDERVPLGETVERDAYGAIAPGKYHLWVQTWIRNSKGEFVFSQRSESKETEPLKWETVSGHAISGETSLEAAVREAREEVGITLDPAKGQHILTRIRSHMDGVDHYNIHDVWLFESDEEPDLSKATTPDEVIRTGWKSLDEIRELYDRDETTLNVKYIFDVVKNPVRDYKDVIGKTVNVIVNAPVMSCHTDLPEVIYPINFGITFDVTLSDARWTDLYVLGTDEPLDRVQGKVIAVYHRYDSAPELIVSLTGEDYDENVILAKIAFREQYFFGKLVK